MAHMLCELAENASRAPTKERRERRDSRQSQVFQIQRRVVVRIVLVPTTHTSESFPLAISAINLAATVTPLRRLVGRHVLYADAHLLASASQPVASPG